MKSRTLLVTFDGVLCHGGFRIQAEPVMEHIALVKALEAAYRLVYVVPADADLEHADTWLLTNLGEMDPVVLHGDSLSEHLRRARLGRYNVVSVLTSDPGTAAEALRLGLTPLLLTSPSYARPEFRPDWDRDPRPWDAVIEEVDHQRRLKARDERAAEQDANEARFERKR